MAVQVPIRPVAKVTPRRQRGQSPSRASVAARSPSSLPLISRGPPALPASARRGHLSVAANRQLWEDLVVENASNVVLPLHLSPTCDVWLLAWQPSQDTDWHDHGDRPVLFVSRTALFSNSSAPGGAARRSYSSAEHRRGRVLRSCPRHNVTIGAKHQRSACTLTHRLWWP